MPVVLAAIVWVGPGVKKEPTTTHTLGKGGSRVCFSPRRRSSTGCGKKAANPLPKRSNQFHAGNNRKVTGQVREWGSIKPFTAPAAPSAKARACHAFPHGECPSGADVSRHARSEERIVSTRSSASQYHNLTDS